MKFLYAKHTIAKKQIFLRNEIEIKLEIPSTFKKKYIEIGSMFCEKIRCLA